MRDRSYNHTKKPVKPQHSKLRLVGMLAEELFI